MTTAVAPAVSPAGYESVVAEYGQWLKSWGASPRTVDARTVLAQRVLREWGVGGLTVENVQAMFAAQDNGWTLSTYHSNLTCFCSWLVATGRLAQSPMDSIRKPVRPKSRPRPLSDREVSLVLSSATGRTRDWINLALLAGLRAHEIAKIRGEDVEVDGIYVEGKGGTKEVLPCHPDLWEMAQRYPRNGYWFPGRLEGKPIGRGVVTTTVSEMFDKVGIKGSIHRCRHTYGTRLLRDGVHIRTVQKLLRHASLATTALYTAVDEDELRAAVNGLRFS